MGCFVNHEGKSVFIDEDGVVYSAPGGSRIASSEQEWKDAMQKAKEKMTDGQKVDEPSPTPPVLPTVDAGKHTCSGRGRFGRLARQGECAKCDLMRGKK